MIFSINKSVISKFDIDLQAGEMTEIPIEMGNHVWKMSCSLAFSSFDSVKIGKGRTIYQGGWLYIDSSVIEIHANGRGKTDILRESLKHNLHINSRLMVFINQKYDLTDITVMSETGRFFYTTNTFGGNYNPFIETGSPLNVERFNFDISEDCSKKILYIGDSYAGSQSRSRVPGTLYLSFNIRSFMTSNMSGGNALTLYRLLNEALQYVKPEYVIWTSGMNDQDFSVWLKITGDAIRLIESTGAIPVLCTVPSVPDRDKTAINRWIRSGKYRYIDFSIAVSDDKGIWNEGMLSEDKVHPSELGASALALRVLIDFPEIMKLF
jgi:hypothetical protein